MDRIGGKDMLNYKRYKRVPVVNFPERTWPGKEIMKAPVWCSVDLRDGNQALVEPMVVEEKVEMFNLLVKLGFKEIEVGFPAASQIEYDFLRTLVERKLIPDDVEVQVLVQCREHLIKRTFEALEGIKKAIEHIYTYSTKHSESIVTENKETAKYFMESLDSACVYHNASTRFSDGGEFGFGAEVGISTQKLHARGPLGLQEITSTKYMIYGKGQVRS